MLNFDEAKRIGINACIDRLGRDFVRAHKDVATSAYSEGDGSVFCFVGVDHRHTAWNQEGVLTLDSRSEFPYRASCNVDLANGRPSFIECVTP